MALARVLMNDASKNDVVAIFRSCRRQKINRSMVGGGKSTNKKTVKITARQYAIMNEKLSINIQYLFCKKVAA